MKKITFLILWFVVIFNPSLFSQDFETIMNPKNIMIGDPISLEIKVSVNVSSSQIVPMINENSIGTFRIIEKLGVDTLFSGGRTVYNFKYQITNFEDSLQFFPPQKIVINSDTFFTIKQDIMVSMPNVDSLKDVLPIKPIVQIPLSKEELANYLFMSVFLMLLVLLMFWVYIKYIKKEALFDKNDRVEPPHVVALTQLKKIENDTLWQRGYVKEYYDSISDTIRLYIEKRFGIKALELTTPQIIQNVQHLGLEEAIFQSLKNMLDLSDLAKFAKENPSSENNKKCLEEAYRFVQSTQSIQDSNKEINANKAKKFYGQNIYYYRRQAVHQNVFKILIYGLSTTWVLLALIVLLSYSVPIYQILVYLADYPVLFFGILTLLGMLITIIIALLKRNSMLSFSVLFDHDAIFTRSFQQRKKWMFNEMESIEKTKNGDLILKNKYNERIVFSKYLEYYDEIEERLNWHKSNQIVNPQND